MNQASISVMFNISEGFLRRSDPDTLKFLQYSSASNGELKSGYYAAQDREYLTPSETRELITLNESISKMLWRWKATLEPSRRSRSRTGPRTKDRTQDRTKDGTKDSGLRTDRGPTTKD